MQLHIYDGDRVLVQEGEEIEDIYVVISGSIDIRKNINKTEQSSSQSIYKKAQNGDFGDLIETKVFHLDDDQRCMMGLEGIVSKKRPGFTFMTSHHQSQNEGKVILMKINAKQFKNLGIPKEYMNKIVNRES